MAWNGSDQGKAKVEGQGKAKAKGQGNSSLITPRSSLKRGILAGLVVVLGGALALYLVLGRASAPEPAAPQKAPPKKSVPAKLVLPPTNVVEKVEKRVENGSLPPWREEFMDSVEMRLKYGKLFHSRTNEFGFVTERYRLPNGQTWRRMIEPPPLFENRADQAIMMALSDQSGASIPPVPGLDDVDLDAEFAKSFLSPIEIKDDDKPEVAALKLMVKETRSEIADMIKNGDTRTLGEILQEHIDLNNRTASIHAEALNQIENVRKTEGDDFAAEYKKRINESFMENGIPQLINGDDSDEEAEQSDNQ